MQKMQSPLQLSVIQLSPYYKVRS